MLKKLLIPITLLFIFLMPVLFAYGNGYLFYGEYYGTSKWVYHYRDSQGVRYRERGTDDMGLAVAISSDGKTLYLALFFGYEEAYEVTLPIKLLHMGKGIIFVKVRYEYSEITSGGWMDGRGYSTNSILPPIIIPPRPHPIYRHHKYLVTLVIRGSDYQLCRMSYFETRYSEDLVNHYKTIESVRLVFSGEAAEFPILR